MKNQNWHTVYYLEYETRKPLRNLAKRYTLLYNIETGNYCVAYKFNTTTNEWAQGHYFNDFDDAVKFMYLD